jgi:hypothetical protein
MKIKHNCWEIIFVFAFNAIISVPCYAEEWAVTYGGPYQDSPRSIQQSSDGGYIVSGRRSNPQDLWVVKLNSDGSIAWHKNYADGGDPSRSYGNNSIRETFDEVGNFNGYIVAVSIFDQVHGSRDFWVLKLNPEGDIVWQKTYDNKNYLDIPYSIQQTTTGGYIVAGVSQVSDTQSDRDFWVLKLDPEGDIIW